MEIDYEKKYEEALAKARAGKTLEEIFPEMNESEDERMIDESNLLEEIQNYYKKNLAGLYITFAMYKRIARYFYFLGKNEKR